MSSYTSAFGKAHYQSWFLSSASVCPNLQLQMKASGQLHFPIKVTGTQSIPNSLNFKAVCMPWRKLKYREIVPHRPFVQMLD
jgi:hypothetical protein